jgi:TetR/AcrR family transcriptional regulator
VVVSKRTRSDAREALLDAAERLLIDEGYAAVTTRRLAQTAGINHGLVHYYFGSMEQVLLATATRATDRILARQREMYAADVPFLSKWRTAMSFLEQDLAAGYSKLTSELRAMAWNHPEIRAIASDVNRRWREVLTEAFTAAAVEYGIDPDDAPIEALVALAMTFQIGLVAERLMGVTAGHEVLLESIDEWLQRLERDAKPKKRRRSA